MKRINDEYFNQRDKGYDSIYFFENGSVVEFIADDPRRYDVGPNLPNAISLPHVKIGFVGGRLRLR